MESETVTGTQVSKPKKRARDWYTKYKNCLNCIIAIKWSTQQSHSRAKYCIAQKVHPLLITKISDLMSSNICDFYEVKNMIKHYSDNELAKELGFKPNEHDHAFYPDIQYKHPSVWSQ